MNTFVYLIATGLVVIPLWRIFKRAGLAPALSLLAFILPIIPWLILAFADWPRLARRGMQS
ncbi:MAG: hypothetical protein QOK29_2446 [Rhodospirillaceae bacterium]|jgi:hypothetical protein|nr:hypothetical protein [Rhodospirillaceae bacterium]